MDLRHRVPLALNEILNTQSQTHKKSCLNNNFHHYCDYYLPMLPIISCNKPTLRACFKDPGSVPGEVTAREGERDSKQVLTRQRSPPIDRGKWRSWGVHIGAPLTPPHQECFMQYGQGRIFSAEGTADVITGTNPSLPPSSWWFAGNPWLTAAGSTSVAASVVTRHSPLLFLYALLSLFF